jgi:N-hydroxyarylamine O-acetyltransferase
MIEVGGYLDRIGYEGAMEPSVEVLRELHRAHLYAVPFENLDIHLGRPIVLEEAALYHKVVEQRRGGFCYELNGLFAALLRALGFEVSLLEAGVRVGEGESFGPPFDHLLLAVRCAGPEAGGRWLADVGFGEGFLDPLRFAVGQAQEQENGAYRIDAADGDYLLRRQATGGGAWDAEHRFRDTPQRLASFEEMCRYHQTSPDSPFTQRRVCSLATPDGRLTLRDTRLIITQRGRRSEQAIGGEPSFRAALRAHFGIELPGPAAVGAGPAGLAQSGSGS